MNKINIFLLTTALVSASFGAQAGSVSSRVSAIEKKQRTVTIVSRDNAAIEQRIGPNFLKFLTLRGLSGRPDSTLAIAATQEINHNIQRKHPGSSEVVTVEMVTALSNQFYKNRAKADSNREAQVIEVPASYTR